MKQTCKPRLCKGKNCQKPLPAGYKYSRCEACRNRHIEMVKKVAKGSLGVGAIITTAVVGNPLKK